MLLEVESLSKSYPGPEGPAEVLRGVDLTLDAGSDAGADRRIGLGQEHAAASRRRARHGR